MFCLLSVSGLTRLRPKLALVPDALTILVALGRKIDRLRSLYATNEGFKANPPHRGAASTSSASTPVFDAFCTFSCNYQIIMGANQSQPRAMSPEPYMSPEERAEAQAEASEMCSRDRWTMC